MAGIIKTIIEGILEGLDQMAKDPAGPPEQRRVPTRAPAKQPSVSGNAPNQTGSPLSPFPAAQSQIHSPQESQQTSQNRPTIDLNEYAPQAQQVPPSPASSTLPAGPAMTAQNLLKSPGGARTAMIASEILNRPEHRWK